MRNYPLFKKNNEIPTYTNWQHTYVEFLDAQQKSLVDYSNYFLADFRYGPKFKLLGTKGGLPCYSIEDLRYHQYRDTEEEARYYLTTEDYDNDSDNYRIIKAGRHIINNNQNESGLFTDKNWENISVQPMGYTAYYIISYSKGQLNFTYTRNAQLYYGSEQPVSIIDFYTRFSYVSNQGAYVLNTNLLEQKTLYLLATIDGNQVIEDKQGFLWTDIVLNPVMGFTYIKKDNSNSLGEEFIADTQVSWDIRIDKAGVASYNITTAGSLISGNRFWPEGSRIYLL